MSMTTMTIMITMITTMTALAGHLDLNISSLRWKTMVMIMTKASLLNHKDHPGSLADGAIMTEASPSWQLSS